MLSYLHISNIAVIDDLEVEFGPGLNVITGETGSGKSILIDSLGLLLGKRSSLDMIRTGKEKARVEGLFKVPAESKIWDLLKKEEIDTENDEIVIRRQIGPANQGRIHVNGCIVTNSFLRNLAQYLVEIHGQHDTKLLLQKRYHAELLDNFHGNKDLVADVENIANRINSLNEELSSLIEDEHSRLQRLDLLNFQIDEISSARLSPEEEEKLIEKRKILLNSEKLHLVANEGYEKIYESENAVIHQLNSLQTKLGELLDVDSRLDSVVSNLKEAAYQLEDAAYFLRDYASSVEYDEEELNMIEERLDLISSLKRKYSSNVEEILSYLEEIKKERATLLFSDERKSMINNQLEKLKKKYMKKAEELSKIRTLASEQIRNGITKHLKDLAMKGTCFVVELSRVAMEDEFPAKGFEDIEFLISPNIGEELRPLGKIASGGELSRISLAIKLVLYSGDNAALVFDEIDSGIGGKTAEMVGRKLKEISSKTQTFCVTHVPQIAALADNHYRVEKSVRNGKTYTSIKKLGYSEKIDELARMLGGVRVTDITRKHAKQMLGS